MVPLPPVASRAAALALPVLLPALLLPGCTIITDDAYEWRTRPGQGGGDTACQPEVWFADSDGDGFGDPASTTESCDAPAGFVDNDDDCDDGDPAVGDGVLFYGDDDGDGYGEAGDVQVACEAPDGFAASDGDCDDDDPDVNPGAAERCDTAADDDCDGDTNARDALACTDYYLDLDDDGWGDDAGTECWCEPTGDYRAEQPGDCDDDEPFVNPDAAEVCFDGVDNDCDGVGCQLSGRWDAADADGRWIGVDGGEAGERLAMLGDVDGDGRAELAVGAARYADAGQRPGGAFVLAGPATGEGSLEEAAGGFFLGVGNGERAGRGIGALPDQSSDGYDELVVGAPSADDAANEAGVTYIVHGPLDGAASLSDADATLLGAASFDYSGRSVAGLLDATGDGTADLLVGVPGDDQGGNAAGAAFLVAGPVSGTVSLADVTAATLYATAGGDNAGRIVASAGDVDGDGLSDALVGGHLNDDAGNNAGVAWLVLGGASGMVALDDADLVLRGEANGDLAGKALASAGDFDGDGILDVLVGAEGQGSDAGAAYVVDGDTRGVQSLADADLRLLGVADGDLAGAAVSTAGDLDRDGAAEVLVGAPGSDLGGEDAGAVYLVYGGVGDGSLSLDDADLVIEGEEGGLGTGLVGGQDLDGDGTPDFAAGAPDAGGGDGAVRIFLGGGL